MHGPGSGSWLRRDPTCPEQLIPCATSTGSCALEPEATYYWNLSTTEPMLHKKSPCSEARARQGRVAPCSPQLESQSQREDSAQLKINKFLKKMILKTASSTSESEGSEGTGPRSYCMLQRKVALESVRTWLSWFLIQCPFIKLFGFHTYNTRNISAALILHKFQITVIRIALSCPVIKW